MSTEQRGSRHIIPRQEDSSFQVSHPLSHWHDPTLPVLPVTPFTHKAPEEGGHQDGVNAVMMTPPAPALCIYKAPSHPLFIYFFILFYFILFYLGWHLQHVEVRRLGAKWELQLPATATPDLSHNAGSLTQ